MRFWQKVGISSGCSYTWRSNLWAARESFGGRVYTNTAEHSRQREDHKLIMEVKLVSFH